MNLPKVTQLFNKNQFVIETDKNFVFQSYDSFICKIDKTKNIITIGKNWDYSKTTLKHFYMFLDEYAYSIYSDISNKSNKRAAFQKIIDNGINYNDWQVIYNADLV